MKHPLRQIFLAAALSVGLPALLAPATAQHITTPSQKATAQRVAQAGVPLDELAPNAPDNYTIKRGDTLWAISRLYLKSPWRWPELWGMNFDEIRNPHLIYPGQVLYLDKSSGRAVLRARAASGSDGLQTVKVSPRTRIGSLADAAIPTLPAHLLEPFLAEPALVDAAEFANAPRIVAGPESRVVFARGDRVYARSQNSADLKIGAGAPDAYRVYRNAVPLKDPNNGQILAYEAQYLGNVEMIRPESTRQATDKDGKAKAEIVPATLDITTSKEEMRAGDRLQVAPKREFATYVPRAPGKPIEGARVMSVYGSAVNNVGQNQVVSINRGATDGLEVGHVMAIQSDGRIITDRTGTGGKPEEVKLPDERNGLLMVFKTFDKVSYGLVLNINDTVRVGDRLINPR
jgi:LysM repeat protein